MCEFAYAGSELEIFEKAIHWKRYFIGHMAKFIRGNVLEAGAGIGANIKFFADLPFRHWTCMEPDRAMEPALASALPDQSRYGVVIGTLQDLPGKRFDTILYIDVLEHIENDRAELESAAAHLNPGGHVIVLAPAHQWLYTPFDKAIGHFRRYTKATLAAAAPPSLKRQKLIYLDSAGMAASAANRLVLKQSMPTHAQIQTWDRMIVPVSRILDPLLGYSIGKSVLGVWRAE
jgi:SAM-dependent methyltransferase